MSYADDEPYLFQEGSRRRFGRDDDVCDIPVWEQVRSSTLSKVAGELWVANGQMWVRNLSTAHELVVAGPGTPPTTLAARVDDEPGQARSVPSPVGVLTAPSTGGWRIVVERARPADGGRSAAEGHLPGPRPDPTVRIGPVPAPMRATAEALCRPLLDGSSVPASHAEVGRALGVTERAGRRRVEELCEHYRPQVESLPGGQRPGETLTAAVARLLVERRRVPRGPGPEAPPAGGPG